MVDNVNKICAAGFATFTAYLTWNGIREIITHYDLVNAGRTGMELYWQNTQLPHLQNGVTLLALATISGVGAIACYLNGRRNYLENQDAPDSTLSLGKEPV
ncbi:MAG: hypothetical protein V1944_02785 [Candidatus Aenigmatarchaeota archaeon]